MSDQNILCGRSLNCIFIGGLVSYDFTAIALFCVSAVSSDRNTPVQNYMPVKVIARYVKVNPQGYNFKVAMRLGIYGCAADGKSRDAFERLLLYS